MAPTPERRIVIPVAGTDVSGLVIAPQGARACYVLAHGVRAGMQYSFLAAVAKGLAERNVATLRFQFPFMEEGRKQPDSPKRAQATIRAAVSEAARHVPGLPLIAGGKSYGAWMTAIAQAEAPLRNVRGLAFLGFQLRLTGEPLDERAGFMSSVKVPMLFLVGTHDDLAEPEHLKPLVERLGPLATLKLFDDADDTFYLPARAGHEHTDVTTDVLDTLAAWIDRVI